MSVPFERAVERERAERRERRHRRARTGFRRHLRVYVAVNLGLVALWAVGWWLTEGGHPWFLYPLLGWGIGLALHYASARPALGPRPHTSSGGAAT
jgi:fatty acid desaturase